MPASFDDIEMGQVVSLGELPVDPAALEAFIAAFHDFLARIVPGGLLVACRDDAGASGLLDVARARGALPNA